MKVLVQNLQKRPGLASELASRQQPDVMLAQEISWSTEDEDSFRRRSVCYTSSATGYGTAIYSVNALKDVRHVRAPQAEFGGLIHKKTVVAVSKGIQFVSFHGYNGQPFKQVSHLVDHVLAVLAVLPSGDNIPTVFAGDFNTWSKEHLDAITIPLSQAGFTYACSWPYPGRSFPLDHVFLRCVKLISYSVYKCASDHQGAILDLAVDAS